MEGRLRHLISALAMEEDIEEESILLMRGTHIPGMQEYILSHMPIVQIYFIGRMGLELEMSASSLRAGVIWQRAKLGTRPRPKEYLPTPKGKPVVLGPHPPQVPPQVLHCHLRPAHDQDEIYVVHVDMNATITDVLKNLEPVTGYPSSSMLIIKEGCVILYL